MKNRKRNIQLKIWATAEERKLIEHKMSLVSTNQIGAYLQKMAIDGYIIKFILKKDFPCFLIAPRSYRKTEAAVCCDNDIIPAA